MRFSGRTPEDISHNPIAQAVEGAQGKLWDLTQSNPTVCGFHYPKDLLKSFANSQSLLYDAQAFGLAKARETLSRYLASKDQMVHPDNLVLTASSSEAYSYLFKLLGNPGDSFMVPTPGYPLLDHLLHLDGLELNPYVIQTQSGWPIDLTAFECSLGPRTKGIITVNPHNPTGAFLDEKTQTNLLSLCEKHSLAYISDEVFSDYAYGAKPLSVKNDNILSFRLGGLSKSLGLPQLKLSWMSIDGPSELVYECKNRLELIADTYLSVNTPVQVALEDLLGFAPDIQKQILTRVMDNRKQLEKALVGLKKVKVWPAQGGWYALVEVLVEEPSDEELVIRLLKDYQVLVQPGGFYDFSKGCFLVLSLLPQPDVFETGSTRLRQFLEGLRL